jgi:hypothetical protein
MPRQRHPVSKTAGQTVLHTHPQVERLSQPLRCEPAAQQWSAVKHIDHFVRYQPLR